MDAPFTIAVIVTCECEHAWPVPLSGEDPASITFRCPNCRGRARFSQEQAEEIVAEYEAVTKLIERTSPDIARQIMSFDHRSKH
jgi:hypothetical protein